MMVLRCFQWSHGLEGRGNTGFPLPSCRDGREHGGSEGEREFRQTPLSLCELGSLGSTEKSEEPP